MSKAPAGGEGEGVSRWRQRQAAKQMMYAMSVEGSGDAIAARRHLQSSSKYEPEIENWKGKAWGLASTKVSDRQDPKKTRFSGSGSGRGETYYGQKRELSSELPPEDPVSWLHSARSNRGGGGKGGGGGGSGKGGGGGGGGSGRGSGSGVTAQRVPKRPREDGEGAREDAAPRESGGKAKAHDKDPPKARKEEPAKRRRKSSGSGSDSGSGSSSYSSYSSSSGGSYSSSSSSSRKGKKKRRKANRSSSSRSRSSSSSYSSYSSSSSSDKKPPKKSKKTKK